MNGDKPKVYSTAEAAAYVGLALDVFKYHIYDMKHVKPDLQLGRELGFYKSTLDEFLRQYRSTDYTITEAAAYLGVSVNRMKHHVHHLNTLRPTGKRGKYSTFSQASLEEVREIITAQPTAGRPPKNGAGD